MFWVFFVEEISVHGVNVWHAILHKI